MFGIEENAIRRMRIAEGKRITLDIGNGITPVDCRVGAVRDATIYLEIPDAIAGDVISVRGEKISLSYLLGREMFRFETVLGDYSLGTPLVAIIPIPAQVGRRTQRRVHNRTHVETGMHFTVPVGDLSGDDPLLRRHEAITINIGFGGVLFRTSMRLETGKGVHVFFDSRGSDHHRVSTLSGRVVRTRPGGSDCYETAVVFSGLNEVLGGVLSGLMSQAVRCDAGEGEEV
ncbi:MAG: hypothetical protein CVV64_02465 [Candidatus Wallbacteria bacterium HGW-Wallbacteria-1]|jgi:hypothetical protein|uniref:PilZ domain-containing protein n=1 Tax=Candidatus Wallbacteria bacterium HGW-Wallbacteria-1 TaxID=2013854 RepID=A0A2N1PVD2_9BACT|nr:MAG: hypothetical protein CVV64_02465 [Candidatus Wallbacteria bacterium HGW-Wallbacteria-1]